MYTNLLTSHNITKVTDINKKFIEAFLLSCKKKDYYWITNTTKTCINNTRKKLKADYPNLSTEEINKKVSRQYFASLRSEFAKHFYPELFAEKKSTTGTDSLLAAIEKRAAQLNLSVA